MRMQPLKKMWSMPVICGELNQYVAKKPVFRGIRPDVTYRLSKHKAFCRTDAAST